ncbi:uncharacterized protein LOC105420657 isoform X2 [Amborella trichopoda]|uniref:uncharacterized protein LOC105420657 isoform X2 n=1 Tax=Amborella trichopoda TaxID=13333 RepID=UPI0005D4210D|nr:uncharacterized protein LOC105420657 isoform X2 [Amborella trichopoda]|eukprot:XP_011623482.1 uncharacterized protein LOC105420657 isoform X2 [Amborella trichopoda]
MAAFTYTSPSRLCDLGFLKGPPANFHDNIGFSTPSRTGIPTRYNLGLYFPLIRSFAAHCCDLGFSNPTNGGIKRTTRFVCALSQNGSLPCRNPSQIGSGSVGDIHRCRSSLESLFCYDKPIPEEIIEKPVGLSLGEKSIGNNPRCVNCEAKGCGGTGNMMCSDCGGRGHL